MKLTLLNRLMLQKILPQTGSFVTLTIKEDIDEKIKITQKEMKDNKIGENSTFAELDKAEKEVKFTEAETEMIKKELSKLDKEEKLNSTTLPLYKLFYESN